MVLVNASILPHGAMLLDLTLPNLPKSIPHLHAACGKAGEAITQSKAETIILFTPHGIQTQAEPVIYLNGCASGNAGWNGLWETYDLCAPCDQRTALELLNFLSQNSSAKASGVTCFSRMCAAPLAWGEVVPLHFCKSTLDLGTNVIVFSWPQLRLNPTKYAEEAVTIGQQLYEFAAKHPKRISLVFSCDLSHVHGCRNNELPMFQGDPSLGENQTLAKHFDSLVVDWVNHLANEDVNSARKTLLEGECMRLVVEAKCCGWPGFCALQGCLEKAAANICSKSKLKGATSREDRTFQTAISTPREIEDGDDDYIISTKEQQRCSKKENSSGSNRCSDGSVNKKWNGINWGYSAPTYFGMLVATFSFDD